MALKKATHYIRVIRKPNEHVKQFAVAYDDEEELIKKLEKL